MRHIYNTGDLQYIIPKSTGLRTHTANCGNASFLVGNGIKNPEGSGYVRSDGGIFLDFYGIANAGFLMI